MIPVNLLQTSPPPVEEAPEDSYLHKASRENDLIFTTRIAPVSQITQRKHVGRCICPASLKVGLHGYH